ncbi:hypothetical protein MWMV2_MWMV2_03691 [Acinetobacter oleivorans]|uniref:hypothetical protein n=1 Tax=Acinetobacter oleivorans TaxID=1148157 RepID=UPI0021EFECDA|nr:hypothetical protein MWMV3_MWMV3_03693 [Acinetobacter oleivorans]CAI3119503.1 hypothetical protein MWMV12_MWMV12_03655 [Acinetobacter oleivorans]CAI3119580.1 hypothetical protein MWMV19_MWMV19_03657 [Acinetobacter oleivorans]CAI3120157.1 hypothetical protein MWMV5_MWMV5_03692 [Acinetobacter oleivorans]CAI3120165.1 hypothetical protein MWMV13_MWMV13_03693 [Acinetobacter oleivorans]
MSKSVVVFSCSVAALILTFLLFSMLGILFFYWGDHTAVKDSLSTVSGIFGGITTIGAAVIAAYLFNDWKIQQRYQNTLQFGLDVYSNFKILDDKFTQIKNELCLVQAHYEAHVVPKRTNALDYFLDKSEEISRKNLEILIAFNKFHESYLNYLIVTDQENKIDETLPYTSDSINKYYELLGKIKFESESQKRKFLIDELLIPPFSQIDSYIYNYYIKSILIKIRE